MPHTNSKQRSATRSQFKKDSSSKLASKKKPIGKNGRSSRAPVAVFDESDRYQYLTGFSTRKKAAKEAAQKRALQRAREEKLDFRKQLRETRLAKVKETLNEQAEWYGTDAFSSIEIGGISEKVQTETLVHEVQDELKENKMTATVTIEPFEVDHSVLLEDKPKPKPILSQKGLSRSAVSSTRPSSKSRPSFDSSLQKPKKKKITKIPYESKATRTIERAKKQRKRDSKAKAKDSKRSGGHSKKK